MSQDRKEIIIGVDQGKALYSKIHVESAPNWTDVGDNTTCIHLFSEYKVTHFFSKE
jgi:hypothetical protein